MTVGRRLVGQKFSRGMLRIDDVTMPFNLKWPLIQIVTFN